MTYTAECETAFAPGQHQPLGARSLALDLGAEVERMFLNQVPDEGSTYFWRGLIQTAVKRIWHIHDSHGQMVALGFRFKSRFVLRFKLFPLHSEAALEGLQAWREGKCGKGLKPRPSILNPEP